MQKDKIDLLIEKLEERITPGGLDCGYGDDSGGSKTHGSKSGGSKTHGSKSGGSKTHGSKSGGSKSHGSKA
ncbi:MAG: hypothetical protein U0236_08900 [Nitrospira sp.]